MNDHVEYFCSQPEHRGAEPNDALTMHHERWAYCPAGAGEPHNWQPTGGMSLADVKQFVLRRPIWAIDASEERSD